MRASTFAIAFHAVSYELRAALEGEGLKLRIVNFVSLNPAEGGILRI
jgi:hypothetical protein